MSVFVNVTSMVYVKNGNTVGWSGPYRDYTVTRDGIFVLNPGTYTFVLYGPLDLVVRAGGRYHLLHGTLSMHLEQHDLVRLCHTEPRREFYQTTVLLFKT